MAATYQGRPCKRGHKGVRYISNRQCVDCQAEWRADHREEHREYVGAWYEEHKADCIAKATALYAAHPERWVVYGATSRRRHPKRKLADTRARQAGLRTRTPRWADRLGIKDFYAACPKNYEVDHAIPLHGKTVSGLHTLSNLQYLPKAENRKKRNLYAVA